MTASIRSFLWSFVGQTQSPNNNMSLLYNIKQHRFHVAVGIYSNRSQRTSKCGKIISDTLGCASSTRSLPHFDVISYLSQNRLTAHGICLLSITQHKLKNLYSFSGSPIVCENANWLFFLFLQGFSLSILGVVTLHLEYSIGAKASLAVNRGTPSPSWLGVTVSRYISFCHCYYHTTAINCLYFYTRLPSTATIFDFVTDCHLFLSMLVFSTFHFILNVLWVSLSLSMSWHCYAVFYSVTMWCFFSFRCPIK